MRPILLILFLFLFNLISFGQEFELKIQDNNQLELYHNFKQTELSNFEKTVQFSLVSIANPKVSQLKLLTNCNTEYCRVGLTADFDRSQEYILIMNYKDLQGKDKKNWVNLQVQAVVRKSDDVYKLRDEVVVASNVPVKTPSKYSVNLAKTEIKIDKEKNLAINTSKPIEIKDVVNASSDKFTLVLKDKLRDAVTTTASVEVESKDGKITAAGSIETPGFPSPPEPASTQISLTNVTAVNAFPVFELTGMIGFRNSKFSTLVGKYCADTKDEAETECKNKTGRFVYFDNFRPTVSFDIGFQSTKSKNSIILNAPFVFYFNQAKRTNIDKEADENLKEFNLANPKIKATALKIYGGWRSTPFFRLANLKLSVGPKVEFYRRYQPRNYLGSVQVDFEFHRWLGTIATRRRLFAADFDSSPDDKKLFGQLNGLNFGWKLIPFLAFDGGRKFKADDKVEATVGGVKQEVNVPQYNIARFYGGAVGNIEWLVLGRYFGFNMDYRLSYLATTEFNTYKTHNLLLLKGLKGFHPFFKTSFEFALDPAKRYTFKTTWENGRTLPTLEYLNKLSTGINISY